MRKAVVVILGLLPVALLSISCDDPFSEPPRVREEIPRQAPRKETPKIQVKTQKSKQELIQLYFYIKELKKEMEERANSIVKLREADDPGYNYEWAHWKKWTSENAPPVLVKINTYSPVTLDLPPEHPQVLLWLALKELNDELAMYNRYFSLQRPIDPELPKRLDEQLEKCHEALEAYSDPEEQ